MSFEPPPDDKRCTAHTKSTGERCSRWAIRGSNVCPKHGGALPQVKRKAKERLATAKALTDFTREMNRYGRPVQISSTHALEEELWRSAGIVAHLEAIISGPKDPLVGLYLTERGHYVKIATACVAAGLEERRVRLAEAQAAQIAAVFQAVIVELGYADDPRFQPAIARHLRAVS